MLIALIPVLGFTDGVQEYYATADSATVSEDGSMLYFHRDEFMARGLSVVDFILQAYSDIEMRFGIKMGIAM